jgi:hypothetical protein
MLFLSEPVVTCGFYTNQKLLLFIRSTFLQCADAKRVQLIYQQLYLSGCSTFALDGPRLLCYISDLVHHYHNKISIRVRFLFVFLQFPLSNENHPTQITFHLSRIATCSRSYLWIVEEPAPLYSVYYQSALIPCTFFFLIQLLQLGVPYQ